MGRAPLLALGGALALSLALNARLASRREVPPPSARPAAACPPPVPPPARAEIEQRLERCEKKGWDLVLRTLAEEHARDRSAGAPPPDAGTGPATQTEALCRKAESSLREQWERDRENIVKGLTRSLGDRDEQQKNLAGELDQMRRMTGMSQAELGRLEPAYREARQSRIAEALIALQREPPDLAAVLTAARRLYADEDALLRRFSGEAAVEAWRAAQLEGRTVILAMAATLAGQDWNDSIRW